MTTHANRPVRRGEVILAVYGHAHSCRMAEAVLRRPEWIGAAVVFLLTLALPYPRLAAVLFGAVAVSLTLTGWVLSVREARGTCDRIIREAQARDTRELL